jgi:hypothetical protein
MAGSWGVARRNIREKRSPELGDIGWQLQPRHWRWITEWVIAWRFDINSAQMLERAHTLAYHLLEEDGCAHNPFDNPTLQGTVPDDPWDLDNRLSYTFATQYPDDWRLTDEIYPAIFVAVAGWLRGSGRASSSNHVLAAAPWLKALIPSRRPRMAFAIAGLQNGQHQLRGVSDDWFSANWTGPAAAAIGLGVDQFEEWSACQATPPDELLEALVNAFIEGDSVPEILGKTLPERFKALTGPNGSGTGMGRGIDLDLLWGMDALCICLKGMGVMVGERTQEPELAVQG